MKGTLFSADFIFDTSGNARLLEINTDTGLTRSGAEFLDFTDFGTLLSDSAFDTLHLIYKPFHLNIVEKITAYVSANVSNITTVTHQEETDCSVYLEGVEDASNKFILRLAYDEGAILDSTYAKNDCELYNLFYQHGSIGDVVPFYLSSSAMNMSVNNLTQSLNSEQFPDFAIKRTNSQASTNNTLRFAKLAYPETGSDYRYNLFLNEISDDDDVLITNYIPQVSGSYNTSVRSMQITYGDDLDLCFLGEFESSALLDIPTSLTTTGSTSDIILEVDRKHKFEFATNYPLGTTGIHVLSSIVSASGEVVKVDLAKTGSDYLYKSYYISGSPDSDYFRDLNDYYYSGSTFPSGSFLTSSQIVEVTTDVNKDRYVHSFTLDSGDEFIVGGGHIIPVLDSTGTVITYRYANNIHDGDQLFDENNSSAIIVSSSVIIGDTDNEYTLIDPNFEVNDTYVVAGVSRNLLVHNPFAGPHSRSYYYSCFVAGTEITLSNGDNKLIEEIVEGDEILTYNHDNESEEPGTVGFVETSETNNVVKIIINGLLTENGSDTIICTLEHPFYANGKYTEAKDLEVDDLLQTNYNQDVYVSSIEKVRETHTVYNLRDVSNNHNFYANNILVHNK